MAARPHTDSRRALRVLMIAGLVSLAGCRDDPNTAPEPPSELPEWASEYLEDALPGFPPEAQQVWQRCIDEDAVGVAGTPYTVGVNCRLVLVDDYPRRYVAYVPDHPAIAEGVPVPVVTMHHGGSGSGERFLGISGWREEADERGFIVLFPTGLEYRILGGGIITRWNDYGLADEIDPAWRPDGYPAGAPWPADDVGFERIILDDAVASAAVDASRLYAAGFSNGAGLTTRLAVELSDWLAAAAAFAGAFDEEHSPVERIPLLIGVGTLDDRIIENVNAALLPGQDSVTELPLDFDSLFRYATVERVRNAVTATFGLDATAYTTETHPLRALARFETPLPGSTAGNVFILGVVKDVPHVFPRGQGRTGPPNNPHAFDAARTFWQFFQAYARP